MNIAVRIGNTQQIFTLEQAKQMILEKKLFDVQLGLVEGQIQWAPLNQIPELSSAFIQKTSGQVGFLLGVGILLLPYFFAWVTLRKGFSNNARILAFIWMAIVLIYIIAGPRNPPRNVNQGSSTNQTKATPDDKITFSKFEDLEMGMRYSQTVSILGKDGTKTSENELGDFRTELYHWSCGILCGVDLYFSNGKLSQKTQVGLK